MTDDAQDAEGSVTDSLPVQRELPDSVRAQWKGMGPPVGVFSHVDEAQYHAGPGFSCSDAKILIGRSPAHYRAYKNEERTETPAKTFGSALHIAILEPWAFDSRVVCGLGSTANGVRRNTERRKNADKEAWAEFEKEHADKHIIPYTQWTNLIAISDAVLSHPTASTLLTTGEPEQSVYFLDDESIDGHEPTYRLLKMRMDWNDTITHNVIVDLKSAEDASFTGFMRAATRYQYPLQSTWYQHGLTRARAAKGRSGPDGFVFVAFEKEPPYAVGCYEMPPDMHAFSRAVMARALMSYDRCLASNEWPSYDPQIRTLEFPPWAKRMDIA